MNNKIKVRGARQNNLKGLDIDLPLNELIVVTGVSGSGKSSFAFDTLYAEGQRRYVETFSPYARQFLDRMDKPQTESIEGIPPAIAIDQTNPVRTSRSTVGTMTELSDHLKLLFARAAILYCHGCGRKVQQDSPESVAKTLIADHSDQKAVVSFCIQIPDNFSRDEIMGYLRQQGYARVLQETADELEMVQDRLRLSGQNRSRLVESLESAMSVGKGRINIRFPDADKSPDSLRKFSTDLHCAHCDLHFSEPTASQFSFNSPIGACETCRGFGRVMGIDYRLVIPDESKSLAEGAVRPWQSGMSAECQQDLMRNAKKRKVPFNVPWQDLDATARDWVVNGDEDYVEGKWYGVERYFSWLESNSYKMHVRVLLSRYRSYDQCPECLGSRLKYQSLGWRIGSLALASKIQSLALRSRPRQARYSDHAFATIPGFNIHDLVCLPIKNCKAFFDQLELPAPLDEAADQLLAEIRTRFGYLSEVGLEYLTLDRQSRTLSGGEVQRINLTTALGTSLVNTLFVLDEPSIGLHARDIKRLIGILSRLRDAGNSLVVVEHDPQVILAADRVLDIGPGPGARGGEIVFYGTPRQLLRSRRSSTAAGLRGERQVTIHPVSVIPDPEAGCIEVLGADHNNLKAIDVKLPLNSLVCISGVSGSGKSTLIEEVLYRGLMELKGKPEDVAGSFRQILGHEQVDNVVLVNQAPIGRTTRSNPASYVGALDGIRKLFAQQPLAMERGYTAGTFSFNSGNGRCDCCGGKGFEHVEMQFLSDVYLRCSQCSGRRYKTEILDVRLWPQGLTISDALELTVEQSLEAFTEFPKIIAALQPLKDVGLQYLKLGQPVPTLSGGEAQRLKLAGHLSAKGKSREGRSLFLFDEPTTGLHFEDVAVLLDAFRQLIESGHSLVVIEHDMDLINAADWIIDLGPEGGEAGGEIVFCGTVDQLVKLKNNHTGEALADYRKMLRRKSKVATPVARPRSGGNDIRISRAREHNLRNIDVRIPKNKFTVITGVSGSGKSTVAFDILFAEGQRRYLESLNAYARQFVQPASRPDIDGLQGIPPTVAIEQRTSRGGRKSTVATMTEIYHFLRLLFVKTGVQHCPDCNIPVDSQSIDSIVKQLSRTYQEKTLLLLSPLIVGRKGIYKDLAAWASGHGIDSLRVDGEFLPTREWPRLDRYKEHWVEAPVAFVKVTKSSSSLLHRHLTRALGLGEGQVQVAKLPRRWRSGDP